MRPILLISIFLLFLTSCATINKRETSEEAYDKGVQASEEAALYYDFEDIMIPKQMKINAKESIFFESPQVKTGVLIFEGRVDPVSLFDFFINNMPRDNWRLRSYFKYNRYILVFEKENKDCIITIYDKAFTTELRVWVAPRLDAAEPLPPPVEEPLLP